MRDPACSTWFPRKKLAELFLESGAFTAAFDEASAADSLRPGQPDIELLLAAAAQATGQSEMAVQAARQVVSKSSDESLREQGRRVLLQAGDTLNDMPTVLEAVSGPVAGVSEADACLIEAAANERLGQWAEQVRILNSACERFPSEIRLQLALARALGSQPVTLHS